MNKQVTKTILVVIFTLFSACDKDSTPNNGEQPCGGIDPGIVVPAAYYGPVWHPSGKFIGFNHIPLKKITYPNGNNCFGEYEFEYDSTGFWLIDVDGTNMRRISPMTLYTPSWSPDGEWIVFVIGSNIYKINFTGNGFDTTSLTQLTFEGRNFFPAWSPNGNWIAYDSDVSSPNGMSFIWKMKSDGSQKARIVYDPSKGEIRMPQWSSENKKIIHIRYIGVSAPEIFLMDSSGNNPQRLTNNTFDERYPKYSLNNTIAFVRSPMNVWLMNADGTNQKQITTMGVDVDFGLPFSWSPDGKEIVFTSYRERDWSYSNGTLWIMNIASGESRQLTFNN